MAGVVLEVMTQQTTIMTENRQPLVLECHPSLLSSNPNRKPPRRIGFEIGMATLTLITKFYISFLRHCSTSSTIPNLLPTSLAT